MRENSTFHPLPMTGETQRLVSKQASLICGFLLLLMVTVGGCEVNQVGTNATQSPLNGGRSPTSVITNAGVTVLETATLPAFATGQVVYVPIYSEIYNQNAQTISQLTATLSIRNTDLKQSIIIDTIDYYDSSGQKIKGYLDQPIRLAPLASTAVVISQGDQAGGVGANFIVGWGAIEPKIAPPVIEAVMISTASQQGLSFVSAGRVIAPR